VILNAVNIEDRILLVAASIKVVILQAVDIEDKILLVAASSMYIAVIRPNAVNTEERIYLAAVSIQPEVVTSVVDLKLVGPAAPSYPSETVTEAGDCDGHAFREGRGASVTVTVAARAGIALGVGSGVLTLPLPLPLPLPFFEGLDLVLVGSFVHFGFVCLPLPWSFAWTWRGGR
jgi:hypothetical protein